MLKLKGRIYTSILFILNHNKSGVTTYTNKQLSRQGVLPKGTVTFHNDYMLNISRKHNTYQYAFPE